MIEANASTKIVADFRTPFYQNVSNLHLQFAIIFGKDERVKFEEIRETLSDPVCRQYDEATTYRDGKWVMFEPTDTYEFDDYMKLLAIKRKPNRK